MKERPILFSAPMVRAILDGRKTQTRRIVKPQPKPFGKSSYGGTRQGWVWKPETFNRAWNDDDKNPYRTDSNKMATCALRLQCPYGQPGDRLWVKETWKPDPSWGQSSSPIMEIQEGSNILYRSTLPEGHAKHGFGKWRPSIFMRRWMSRITLEITAIRVERLQDISEEDSWAEGVRGRGMTRYESEGRDIYRTLWESINGTESWNQNPWVWVVEFKKL